MTSALVEMSEALAGLVAQMAERVVALPGRRGQWSSGFWLDRKRILLAEHAVQRSEGFEILLPTGKVAAASLLGRDPGVDLAIAQVEGEAGPPSELHFSDDLRPGHFALAVSLSPDTGLSAAWGMVASVGEGIRTWRGGKLEKTIRLDLAASLGLNGALVVGMDGLAIGLATQVLSRHSVIAVPGSNLLAFADRVERLGRRGRPYLGVGLQAVEAPRGMIVLSVEPASPSAERLLVGDVILRIGEVEALGVAEVQNVLDPDRIGDKIPLEVQRAGQILQLEIEIGERR